MAGGVGLTLNLPKIFEPKWVAEQFVRFLRGKKASALPGGNGSLLFLQRISPSLAQWIMNGIGFGALKQAAGQLSASSSTPR